VILFNGVVGGFSSGNYNFSIMIVWILWWVLLMMVLVPIFSRSWCMMCPLPAFGEWLQRMKIFGVTDKLRGLNLKWPKRLSNMWIMNFLFLGTTFFSGFFTVKPLATFILLGGIIVLGIILSLLFEKRSFCLYVCPVSGFQGLYSNASMTEIRVKDPKICEKHRVKTCVTGSKKGYGCPWFLEPHSFRRNTYCGMCMECFKTCPFDNIAFNLRPPGTDILVQEKRGLDEAYKSFIMLGIAVMFYIAMMGPWGWLKDWVRGNTLAGWLSFIGVHSAMNLLVIPGVFLVVAWLSRAASRTSVGMRTVFVNLSYCLIPMGLAVWIAFSFGFLLPNGSYVLHILSDPFAWGWNLFGTAGIPWTPVLTSWLVPLQMLTLIAGFLVSADYGYKLAVQTYPDAGSARRGFFPLLVFLAAITALFGWLYGG
ncbi:MAG: 4Fe-4S binding protein, partial [Phycisphaerae bacterium]|nr:4Fe-4S binding protein [Phycisphaerae bacterium]